jgi:hypothetical protein
MKKSNLDNMAEKLRIFLESDEGKQSIIDFKNKMKEGEEIKLQYFESQEFNESLEEIKKWMIDNGITMIDGEDYQYGTYYDTKIGSIELPIDEDRYFKLTESVFSKFKDKEDKSIPFANGYVEYKEWKFSWVSGQGSIHRIELNIAKMRNESIKKILK